MKKTVCTFTCLEDFKGLLSIFHGHGVKYLIVGGYAVSLRAQSE